MNQRVEYHHQCAFVKWFTINYSELRPLLTVASFGENIGPKRMDELKKMGLFPGWPDLFLAYPTYKENGMMFHAGLFIEMKTKKIGSVSVAQKEMHARLRLRGYRVSVCWDWEEAKASVLEYLR